MEIKRGFYVDKYNDQFKVFVQKLCVIVVDNFTQKEGVICHTFEKNKQKFFYVYTVDSFKERFTEGLSSGVKIPPVFKSPIKKESPKTVSSNLYNKANTLAELKEARSIVYAKFPDAVDNHYVIDNYNRRYKILQSKLIKAKKKESKDNG